jgi:hypothetical protein
LTCDLRRNTWIEDERVDPLDRASLFGPEKKFDIISSSRRMSRKFHILWKFRSSLEEPSLLCWLLGSMMAASLLNSPNPHVLDAA